MALEVEQGLRINESDHRSVELGQESEASSATLALGQNSQAPQDTVLELQGDTQALPESNSKCEELMKENRQLREQVAKLGIQLRIEKNTSEHLRSVQEELEGEQEHMFNIIENQTLPRSPQQGAEEKQLEELGEQAKQLTEVQEALLREQENNALVTQENERLQQEVARGSLMTERTGNTEEEEDDDLMTQSKQAQGPAAGIGSLMTKRTGNAEEEDKDLMTQAKEAQGPAAGMRKRRSRLRALLRFFQRQRHGSRVPAKSPPESAPRSPEATPAGSGWLEDRDTRSEPLPKATGQQKSAFWSRKKKDKVKDQPPRASSTLSNLLCCCTC